MKVEDLCAYVERDPAKTGRWLWWVGDERGPKLLETPTKGLEESRRAARRQARRSLRRARAEWRWMADPQREEIR